MNTKYFLLLIFSILWCVLHSWLIAHGVSQKLKKKVGRRYKYFRLLYNFFSLITLVAVIAIEKELTTKLIFDWKNIYLQITRLLLLVLSLVLFYLGARQYDGMEFLGLRQLKQGAVSKTLSASGEIHTSGILALIRHPWYTAGIIIIWLRPLYISTLMVNLVFTAYFIVGAYLEERKLIQEFGDEYKTYQRNVSMLLPMKWLKRKIQNWK